MNGVGKLPPGFRFEPTDEEIVFQYLSRKIFSHPLPAQIIPDIDNLFAYAPSQLPGGDEESSDKYFFSKKGNYMNSEGGGFWKAIHGSVKRIICSARMPIVGIRKTFVYCDNINSSSQWRMHQFCIALAPNSLSNINNSSLIRIGEWSLCRIFLKRSSRTMTQADDYMSDTDSSSASSSSPHSAAAHSSIFSQASSR